MVFDLSKVGGIGNYEKETEKEREVYYVLDTEGDKKAFLIVNKNTLEVRCDEKLAKHLSGKYESVMESRYFGRGGIEIVPAGQLTEDEVNDLVRLSYNLTI